MAQLDVSCNGITSGVVAITKCLQTLQELNNFQNKLFDNGISEVNYVVKILSIAGNQITNIS